MGNEKERSILLVDDQPANVKVLLEYLRDKELRVYVADSGERALSTLENIQPDLILLDVMMPGMDGFETCRKIKSIEALSDIPIIFMTALDGVQDKLKGFDAGGVDYISKPFQHVEVLARIHTHIALYRREKELRKALSEIKVLQGILPVCCNCKSIRDDEGYWQQLEKYMSEHTDVQFSHGLCPECAAKLYPELYPFEKER